MVRNEASSSFKPGRTTAAHKLLQKQILAMAIAALEEIPLERRSQTSTTMAISTELIPEAINKIRTFQNDLSELLSRSQRCDEVYQLSISLYPIAKNQRSSL